MNNEQEENDFQVGLETLLQEVDSALTGETRRPYERTGDKTVLEYTTRRFFLDKLLELLGWRLGLSGTVVEEARIKAETTTFMDYVGVNQETEAPALLVEAKAWGTPFIDNRRGADFRRSEQQLLIAAIDHVRRGGRKQESPATEIWHTFLDQVRRYVVSLRQKHGHELPCAVLSSGEWIVLFKNPTKTFLSGDVNDEQFAIFKKVVYVERAREIYRLLSRRTLARSVPFSLRPTQLRSHVTAETVSAAFHALHIVYERTGSRLFDRQPRILVYPALIIQRNDDTLITAIEEEPPIVMDMAVAHPGGERSLLPHLKEVADKAATLLKTCSKEMRMEIKPLDVSEFPGFPASPDSLSVTTAYPRVVRPLGKSGDEWLLATGAVSHYLQEKPTVHPCRFHTWSSCRDVGQQIGSSAVNTPCIAEPRAFFVDTQVYHCAHQTIRDRRQSRCFIEALDQRTCCRICAYEQLCWTPTELDELPCGS